MRDSVTIIDIWKSLPEFLETCPVLVRANKYRGLPYFTNASFQGWYLTRHGLRPRRGDITRAITTLGLKMKAMKIEARVRWVFLVQDKTRLLEMAQKNIKSELKEEADNLSHRLKEVHAALEQGR